MLQQMHDAEAGLVAEAIVDIDERQWFHTYKGIYLNGYILQVKASKRRKSRTAGRQCWAEAEKCIASTVRGVKLHPCKPCSVLLAG
jgi:hypothetical protein